MSFLKDQLCAEVTLTTHNNYTIKDKNLPKVVTLDAKGEILINNSKSTIQNNLNAKIADLEKKITQTSLEYSNNDIDWDSSIWPTNQLQTNNLADFQHKIKQPK